MSILPGNLKIYGSATMADDDSTTQIGGAIDTSRTVAFYDMTGTVQAVSSNSGDTTQTVEVHYVTTGGVPSSETQTLTGQTPVTFAATMQSLLKAIKSATTAGDVAVEAQSASRSNTLQGVGTDADQVQLDAGASATDDAYTGMIFRTTGGTGPNQIFRIIEYVGSTKMARLSRTPGTTLDNTTTFRIAPGFYFEKGTHEILEVRRVFYRAEADIPGGSTRTYYDKLFIKNTHGTLTLTTATVSEYADPSTKVTFAIGTAVNGSGDNGGGNNRQVTPSSGITSFDSADKDLPGDQNLDAGEAIAVWLELTLTAAAPATSTFYMPSITGGTI